MHLSACINESGRCYIMQRYLVRSRRSVCTRKFPSRYMAHAAEAAREAQFLFTFILLNSSGKNRKQRQCASCTSCDSRLQPYSVSVCVFIAIVGYWNESWQRAAAAAAARTVCSDTSILILYRCILTLYDSSWTITTGFNMLNVRKTLVLKLTVFQCAHVDKIKYNVILLLTT